MAPDRALDRQRPEHIAPEHAAEYATLSRAARELVTPETLRRWVADLTPGDYTLADVVTLERRRQANLRTVRQGAELTDAEWKLWRYLCRNTGKTRTYAQIAHHLWGSSATVITSSLIRYAGGYDSHYVHSIQQLVMSIRKKIEIDPLRPQHLATIRGVGYVWYDAPPALDDGIDYDRRGAELTKLRVHVAAQFGSLELEAGVADDVSAEYLDAEIVDAVSVDRDGEIYESRIRTGPEFDRIMESRSHGPRTDWRGQPFPDAATESDDPLE